MAAALSLAVVSGAAVGAVSTRYTLDLARLDSAQLGVVALTGTSTRPTARLMLTTSAGSRFRDVGPQLPPGTLIDDVWSLDRKHLWVVGWRIDTARVTVYRTNDGGRSWHAAYVTTHSLGAGSVATVEFLTPRQGWLVNQQPTAPGATLFASSDGGASWRSLGELPEVAPVAFESPVQAWQAGGVFGRALFHSADGGQTWARMRLPIPVGQRSARALYGRPAFFGREILAPVTFLHSRRADFAVFRSLSDGRRWTLVSLLKPTASASPACSFGLPAPLPVSFVTSRDWWLGVYRSQRWDAYRTANAGQHWRRLPIVAAKSAASCPPIAEMQAIDSRTAWFTFTVAKNRELYATDDSGRRWRRLRPSAG